MGFSWLQNWGSTPAETGIGLNWLLAAELELHSC
jgi:hypothetical protein